MGYNQPDIYENPERFGLEIVGDLAFEHGYEYDILVVFREKDTGRIGVARDSGCSCNSPFEYYNNVEDIEFDEPWRIALRIQEQANAAKDYRDFSDNDVVHLIDKVVNA
ncbi:hypothetical protein AB0C87_25205 [Actinomadura sp. NPDC048021]|uniref:DUF7574 domain-containing protein n=1 Tax=Actinomadura sp. NPDC048021 TaxID=3155385 RepID=UPI0033F8339D